MITRKSRKSAEITVETEEIVVVSGRRGAVRRRCAKCGQEVSMVSPQQAAQIAGVTVLTMYQWITEGKVHSCEPERGALFVCVRSLTPASGARRRTV
ncbi:MAG TPA: hypothetical protein VLW54_11305 [Candidatus Acidoferrales bacterium]|nr:hypothetical protein [Candidatus Acidoferrales bacterium]